MAKAPRLFLLAVLASSVPAASEAAQTSTFTVTTTADAADAAPEDGACETARGNRVCSLRAAIQEGSASGRAVTIRVPAGRYVLTMGALDAARGKLTIRGAGAATTVVDGNRMDRVLRVSEGAEVEISGLAVRNGRAPGGQTLSAGRAGGIYNEGILVLIDSAVVGNTAPDGGGIFNFGTLTLRSTRVLDNTAGNGGGLLNARGMRGGVGGVPIIGRATILGSHFQRNQATGAVPQTAFGGGGAISNLAVVDIVGSTLVGNSSTSVGGAIRNDGTMTIMASTINSNVAEDSGGAITNGPFREVAVVVTVVNTTISGNRSEAGAAISNFSTAVFNASTIYDNGHVAVAAFGPISLANTIIADPVTATNCATSGQITSFGYNLDSGNLCGFTQPTDLVHTDPLLGPLQDNGGPTLTHALLPGSPAVDAGSSAAPGNSQEACPGTDQRGTRRPLDGNSDGEPRCDMGAFEAPAGTTPPPAAAGEQPPKPAPTPAVRLWLEVETTTEVFPDPVDPLRSPIWIVQPGERYQVLVVEGSTALIVHSEDAETAGWIDLSAGTLVEE